MMNDRPDSPLQDQHGCGSQRSADSLDATKLIEMVRTLRGPNGCPWDQEQEIGDTRAYLLEEAHEAVAAIDAYVRSEGSAATEQARECATDALAEELGDLMFQVAFITTLADEQGAFEPQCIVDRVHRKMIERHPHVYAASEESERPNSATEVAQAWAERKRSADSSVLDGVPETLPALTAGYRIGQKAAGLGFDWQQVEQVRDKVSEELAELDQAMELGAKPAIEEELGDLLLSLTSLARHLGVDPERALAGANHKFGKRFRTIEPKLRGSSAEQAEALWDRAKRGEHG